MKASIIYNSQHGTTKAYAEEISAFLKEKGVENKVSSINEYDKKYLQESDLVLLGCWTSGLFLFAQHPDKNWKEFAKEIPAVQGKKLALFTTYKLATGSMFRKMEDTLSGKTDAAQLYLKSKSSKLTKENSELLKALLN